MKHLLIKYKSKLMNLTKDFLNEVKNTPLKKKETFILSESLGKFNKGDIIQIKEMKVIENDIELHLINNYGISDTFYLDKEDIGF